MTYDDDNYDEMVHFYSTTQPPPEMLIQCFDCKARFDTPDEQEFSEPYEFWGERGTRRTVLLVCPECGSENIEPVEDIEEDEPDDE